MDSVSQMFNVALQHHRAGDLCQAESLYRQILQIDPRHVDALHKLGVIAYQLGNNDLAVDYIQRALSLHPKFPVWVALPKVPDWRWLLQREDSPWYLPCGCFASPSKVNGTTFFAASIMLWAPLLCRG